MRIEGRMSDPNLDIIVGHDSGPRLRESAIAGDPGKVKAQARILGFTEGEGSIKFWGSWILKLRRVGLRGFRQQANEFRGYQSQARVQKNW